MATSWAEAVKLGFSTTEEPSFVWGQPAQPTDEDLALIQRLNPRPRECFWNAMVLAIWSNGRLGYVVGLLDETIPHAWCIDTNDNVIDPTLPDRPRGSYLGIVLDPNAVRVAQAKAKSWTLPLSPALIFRLIWDLRAQALAVKVDEQEEVGHEPVRLFHRTSTEAAKAIEADGFIDHEGTYMLGIPMKGVWLSDVPLNCGQGTKEGDDGGVLFEVALDLTEKAISIYELVEDQGSDPVFEYREWCIPADIVNAHGRLRRLTMDEQEEFDDPRFRREPLLLVDPQAVAWRKSRGFESGGLSYFDYYPAYRDQQRSRAEQGRTEAQPRVSRT